MHEGVTGDYRTEDIHAWRTLIPGVVYYSIPHVLAQERREAKVLHTSQTTHSPNLHHAGASVQTEAGGERRHSFPLLASESLSRRMNPSLFSFAVIHSLSLLALAPVRAFLPSSSRVPARSAGTCCRNRTSRRPRLAPPHRAAAALLHPCGRGTPPPLPGWACASTYGRPCRCWTDANVCITCSTCGFWLLILAVAVRAPRA